MTNSAKPYTDPATDITFASVEEWADAMRSLDEEESGLSEQEIQQTVEENK